MILEEMKRIFVRDYDKEFIGIETDDFIDTGSNSSDGCSQEKVRNYEIDTFIAIPYNLVWSCGIPVKDLEGTEQSKELEKIIKYKLLTIEDGAIEDGIEINSMYISTGLKYFFIEVSAVVKYLDEGQSDEEYIED